MSTLNRTQSNNKKPEYKEYIGFLGSYKNGGKENREEQGSVYSSDSGISSVQSFSLNSSVNNSSTSINSDLSTNTQVSCNSVDVCDNVSNCTPLVSYLENYTNKKYSSVQFSSDTLKKKQDKCDNKTVKTELFIQVNNEDTSVSKISKTFKVNNPEIIIKRQNSIKNRINTFENNDKAAKDESFSTLRRSNSKNKPTQKVIIPPKTNEHSTVKTNGTVKVKTNPNPEFARIQKLITVNFQENGSTENKPPNKIPLSPKPSVPPKSTEIQTIKNGLPPLPPISPKTAITTTDGNSNIPPPPPMFSQGSSEQNIIPVPPPFDFADKEERKIEKPVIYSVPPPPPPMMPNNFVAPKVNKTSVNGFVNKTSSPKSNGMVKTEMPVNGFANKTSSTKSNGLVKTETVVPVANENGIDKNNPVVKKLVYNTLRGMYGAYHDQANSYVNTLPKHMVKKDNNLQGIIENIASQGGLDKLNGRVNPKQDVE